MSKQPNIILLILDSVRAANLSCYGYERATTPHIDQLAAQGTLFEQAISVGCWTLPVHTSLFTGLYPMNHGVNISKGALPDDVPTLASQLKQLGYQTACFTNNAYISEATGLTRGFDLVENIWRVNKPRGTKRTKVSRLIKYLEQRGPVTKPAVRLVRALQHTRSLLKRRSQPGDNGAHLTNKKMQDWLSGGRDPEAPFFIFVNYMECHEPYNPPSPYDQRFRPQHLLGRRIVQDDSHKKSLLANPEPRRQEDLEIIRALYDGELAYLDNKIGELIKFMESKGLLDETVIIVTSDHGDSLGEHAHLGHRMALYEQLVHVPLIVRYPARFKPGAQVSQQVSLIDLYPTLFDLAGADLSQNVQNGFYSLITPPGPERRPFVIAENTAPKSLNSVLARMVRTDSYKYVWKSDQQHELYDLTKDPDELVNLVNSEPQTVEWLDEQLRTWQRSHENYQLETREVEFDEMIVSRLRDLGYVE